MLLVGFFALVVVIAVFALASALSILINPTANAAAKNTMGQKLTKMSLSPFDIGLAKQFMDKDNNGKCDVCGMDVHLCIESGQMQCNMDSKSTIGILGSQHIHADWKIYVNGKPMDQNFFDSISMDMANVQSGISSSFIHVDKGALAPEKTGDVIHMHATGVPLWIFFKSVGMDFNKDCLSLPDKQYCNDGTNILKFYVNGVPNNDWENYVFSDLDKILISYGDEVNVSQQLNSITDFAKTH